jgi:septal ring factor EnvC (AmiA/AmiB activator)
MKKLRPFLSKFLSCLLFAAVLPWASSPPLCALPADLNEAPLNELNRLLEISTRLTALNETLRNELSSSKQNSLELQHMLTTSKTELEQLRSELIPLRIHSAELLQSALNSERELNGLRTALKQAETSLLNLEQSWETYRNETEHRITALERRSRFWKYGFFTALILSISGWTAFAVSR